MNTKAKVATAIALVLMALAAVGLNRVQGLQRLGVPGVRVVEQKVEREDGQIVGTNAVPLPEKVLDYKSEIIPVAKIVSEWLPKDTVYGQRIYEAPDKFWIQSTVILMGTDRTSIHKPEYCLTGSGFQTVKADQDSVTIAQPHSYSLPLKRLTLVREAKTPDGQSISQSGIFVYWFVADKQLTALHNERMLWMARDQITTGVLQRWAYVSCFTIVPPGLEDAAYARIKEWIAQAVPHFQITTGSPSGLARNP